MENQFKSYGEFVPQLKKLVQLGIMDRMRTPEFKDLATLIDPYEYRDRLSLPKLLLNSSGDQFFLPDSARFYYRDLPGEKLIRYAPNTDHSLENSVTSVYDSLYTLLGWYQSILLGQQRPQIDWHLDGNQLVASTSIAPQLARVWRASNPLARDFRKVTIGESWVSEPVAPDADGQYRVALPQPAQGYAASYIEFVYQGASGQPVTYSTRIFITPDSLPYVLNDPLYDPQPARYWQRQLDIARSTDNGEISRAQFESYLPLPVFDTYVADTDQLQSMLDPGFPFNRSSADFARRQCMATRLNVKNKQLGWYSDVDLGYLGSGKAWEFYQFADAVQPYGLSWMAGSICFKLNLL